MSTSYRFLVFTQVFFGSLPGKSIRPVDRSIPERQDDITILARASRPADVGTKFGPANGAFWHSGKCSAFYA
jgi:hypothetical protein